MALKDIVIERSEVVYRGGSFSVHGITLDMIVRLMSQGHRKEIEEAVDTLRQAVGDNLEKVTDISEITGALATTVREVPDLAAKLIAGASDEPDEWKTVRDLPISIQLDALLKVGKMTFDGEDSIKKFVANLIELMISIRTSAKPAVDAAREQLAGTKV